MRGHRRPGRICKFVYYALLFFVRDRGGNFGLFASRRVIVGPSHEQGYTALHLAADRGNVATVEFLLKQGADKTLKVSLRVMEPLERIPFLKRTTQDTDGYTATDLATIAQQHNIVALLERT